MNENQNEWEEWWDARVEAIGKTLGQIGPNVLHSPVPFDMGGNADVIVFRQHVAGVVYVTSEMIGNDDQVPNSLGGYELMICHRQDDERGPSLISRLARYACERPLEPGDTMSIGSAVPEGSNIAAFLYLEYARFNVKGREAGLLLCLGITLEELDACRNAGSAHVTTALKSSGVFPFTDWNRRSVV